MASGPRYEEIKHFHPDFERPAFFSAFFSIAVALVILHFYRQSVIVPVEA
jgi:hypothetical protein